VLDNDNLSNLTVVFRRYLVWCHPIYLIQRIRAKNNHFGFRVAKILDIYLTTSTQHCR
jgi:hypothetical protein